MIIAKSFPDDSMRIANIQHDCYDSALKNIVNFAVQEHRKAEFVLNLRDELCEKRDLLQTFDHRTLQWFHDALAGAFRYKYCCKADLFDDSGAGSNSDVDIASQWYGFLNAELRRMFEGSPSLPRTLLTAILYPNPDAKGMAAETRLSNLTLSFYPELQDIE